MSTEKKLPPIQQLAPVKHFTVRLVNGHFMRVPKAENIAPTDATRPPSTGRQEVSPHGDGETIPRGLHLENGRFVNGPGEAVPMQIPPTPGTAAPATPAAPSPNSWAYAFRTQVDPSDSPPKT